MSDAIAIADLCPTQAGLRHPDRLGPLAAVLREGRSLADHPVAVSRFEDGRLYVHNGHHRVAACVLAGRDTLLPAEVVVTDWRYAQYFEINWTAGYVTPFHPASELRVADLGRFRRAVGTIRELAGVAAAERFIWANRGRFAVGRRLDTFVELAACAAAEVDP